ncbi:hypothetical protein K1719_031653 [Acacia pycnantha]|nr:hypothetical protein K1719_031653 [Acacia pycnantha]
MPPVFKAAWNPNKQEREKGAEEVREALKILDKELKVNGKFFNGDSVEFLDIAALIIFYWVWVPIIQEARSEWYSGDKYPNLEEWGQVVLNDPVVKGVLPPRDVLLSFFKSRFQSIVASK